jgi:hypothetical protein
MWLPPISGKTRWLNSAAGASSANSHIVHLLEKVVIGLLCLAVVNLLMVLVTGGYRLNLRFARIAAYNLDGPLRCS